jgi:hypothetical protein
MNPVRRGRKVDLCRYETIEGEIVKVQEHLKRRLVVIAK